MRRHIRHDFIFKQTAEETRERNRNEQVSFSRAVSEREENTRRKFHLSRITRSASPDSLANPDPPSVRISCTFSLLSTKHYTEISFMLSQGIMLVLKALNSAEQNGKYLSEWFRLKSGCLSCKISRMFGCRRNATILSL